MAGMSTLFLFAAGKKECFLQVGGINFIAFYFFWPPLPWHS